MDPAAVDPAPLTGLLEVLVPWSFVMIRVLGIFLFAPLIGGASVPAQYKAALAAAIAMGVFAALPAGAREAPDVSLAMLAPALATELLLGAVIGLLAGLPIVAVDLAGYLIGYQMGLSLATAFNPELETNLNSIGSMIFTIVIATLIGIGGLDVLFGSLMTTFDRVPAGAFAVSDVPVEAYVGALSSGFEIAMRVAAPVMGMALVVQIAMGFMMKLMPQMNLLTVSFALKILGGMSLVIFALEAISGVLAEHLVDALLMIRAWTESLGTPAGVVSGG